MAQRRKTAPARRRFGVALIGGGNMATALIKGLIAAKVYRPAQIVATDVDAAKRAALRRRFGIAVTADNRAAVQQAAVVILAVKPQIIDDVLADLRPAASARRLFISIAAGIRCARLEAGLGERTRVLRVMPNTPALIGLGMSVLARGTHATAADARLGLQLLRAVGRAVTVPDERLLDAVTGLSGSGPAYVYLFAEGLIAGGVAAGLEEALASELALQTLRGAAAMLLQAGERPATLRARVMSPGGTTVAGLGELERRGFSDAVVAAVVTATTRSRQLGGA